MSIQQQQGEQERRMREEDAVQKGCEEGSCLVAEARGPMARCQGECAYKDCVNRYADAMIRFDKLDRWERELCTGARDYDARYMP